MKSRFEELLEQHDEIVEQEHGEMVKVTILEGQSGPDGWVWSGLLGWLVDFVGRERE